MADPRPGWADTRIPRGWAWLVAVIAVAPLAVLPVRAAADAWRAPALLPRRLGTRGLEVLADPGARVGEAVATSLVVATLATTAALVMGWPVARRRPPWPACSASSSAGASTGPASRSGVGD